MCFGWGVCYDDELHGYDYKLCDITNTALALMIHCLATRRDRVVRVDHKTFGKSVLTVKVGTLQMKKLVQNHLIADAMGNVGGEKAPLVAATELLRCKKEKTDLLVGPVARPLLDIYVTWKHQTHLAPRDDKSTYWDWIGDTSDSSLWRCSTSHHPLYRQCQKNDVSVLRKDSLPFPLPALLWPETPPPRECRIVLPLQDRQNWNVKS